ncbi:MAG TPA: 1,4-dihydroxy-2-naphthoate polyprenyltransferase [Gemmatimonadaceae bacterium]|nr:1,4-dihydroxy-2-naphthoate polyprenyltransferase [Gemmatimonadaceae bacterium]
MSAVARPEISRARAWILAARPATLPAAVVPVVVGAAAALSDGAPFRGIVFAMTLICAVLIQIGTNFANDYSDFARGADTEARLGPVRVTQSGLMDQTSVKRGIIVAFGLAVLIGAYLAYVGGWPIIAIGVLSVLSGLAYTGGPYPLGYHGLGDIFVFVFFGVIAVTGTAYLQSGHWSVLPLLLSIPIGLFVTNILVVNNLRDLPTDLAAGKRTLATRIGDGATRAQYAVSTVAAYVIPLVIGVTDPARRLIMLPLISLPLALRRVLVVAKGASGRDLNLMLKRTGQLLLLFGGLLAVGAALSRPR